MAATLNEHKTHFSQMKTLLQDTEKPDYARTYEVRGVAGRPRVWAGGRLWTMV